jgi:hypothetical protein
MSLDNGTAELMVKLDDCKWAREWASTESIGGSYVIAVAAQSRSGQIATELGPNENGHHWPSRRQREHATQ